MLKLKGKFAKTESLLRDEQEKHSAGMENQEDGEDNKQELSLHQEVEKQPYVTPTAPTSVYSNVSNVNPPGMLQPISGRHRQKDSQFGKTTSGLS